MHALVGLSLRHRSCRLREVPAQRPVPLGSACRAVWSGDDIAVAEEPFSSGMPEAESEPEHLRSLRGVFSRPEIATTARRAARRGQVTDRRRTAR